MSYFEKAIDHILKIEGGFVDHPNDPGGATKYGISLRFLKSNNISILGKDEITSEDIKEVTKEKAKEIYKEYFWDPNHYGEIISPHIGTKVFDIGINIGPAKANAMLQRAVNYCLIKRELVIDSIIGPKTIEAINRCNFKCILTYFIQEACLHYNKLVQNNPDLKVFYNGWIKRACDKYELLHGREV